MYRVELDGKSNKMIFRTGGDAALGGGALALAKEKKSKKKHKKHSKKSKTKHSVFQDTDGTCQDTSMDTISVEESRDTGQVWYNTDSLKVKIKL